LCRPPRTGGGGGEKIPLCGGNKRPTGGGGRGTSHRRKQNTKKHKNPGGGLRRGLHTEGGVTTIECNKKEKRSNKENNQDGSTKKTRKTGDTKRLFCFHHQSDTWAGGESPGWEKKTGKYDKNNPEHGGWGGGGGVKSRGLKTRFGGGVRGGVWLGVCMEHHEMN